MARAFVSATGLSSEGRVKIQGNTIQGNGAPCERSVNGPLLKKDSARSGRSCSTLSPGDQEIEQVRFAERPRHIRTLKNAQRKLPLPVVQRHDPILHGVARQ